MDHLTRSLHLEYTYDKLVVVSNDPNKLVSDRRLITFQQRKKMEDSFGGMFKFIDHNYPMWKLRMRDMLVCKDLWLPLQFGNKRPDKIDAFTWEVLHLKAATYIRCFIDMSL